MRITLLNVEQHEIFHNRAALVTIVSYTTISAYLLVFNNFDKLSPSVSILSTVTASTTTFGSTGRPSPWGRPWLRTISRRPSRRMCATASTTWTSRRSWVAATPRTGDHPETAKPHWKQRSGHSWTVGTIYSFLACPSFGLNHQKETIGGERFNAGLFSKLLYLIWNCS